MAFYDSAGVDCITSVASTVLIKAEVKAQCRRFQQHSGFNATVEHSPKIPNKPRVNINK